MNTCEYYEHLISLALDDEIGVEERKELAVHLASCPSCSQLWQLMADVSRMMEDDMEELPEGLHENIMAGIRRSEMIKKNTKAEKRPASHKNAGKTRMNKGLRNVLATAACMAVVLVAALGINPAERADRVVESRMAPAPAAAAVTGVPEEKAAPTESQAPIATETPVETVAPVITEAPKATVMPTEMPKDPVVIITTPEPQVTRVPESTLAPIETATPIQQQTTGNEEGFELVDEATATPQPLEQAAGEKDMENMASVQNAEPSPQPTEYQEPMQDESPAEAPAESGELPLNAGIELNSAAAENKMAMRKAAPVRVFQLFPELKDIAPTPSPEASPASVEPSPQAMLFGYSLEPSPSPEPEKEAELLDMLEKEESRELMLLLLGQNIQAAAAPVESQLPEAEWDEAWDIAMLFDNIPCELSVRIYGDDIYFSVAEVIVEPEEAEQEGDAPAASPGPAPTATPVPSTVPEIQGGAEEMDAASEDGYEAVWFKAGCGKAEFSELLESLLK